jgi:hypothetical protein
VRRDIGGVSGGRGGVTQRPGQNMAAIARIWIGWKKSMIVCAEMNLEKLRMSVYVLFILVEELTKERVDASGM